MEELEIPLILNGPGLTAGHEIRSAVNTYDLAPTIAWIFGLHPPPVGLANLCLRPLGLPLNHKSENSLLTWLVNNRIVTKLWTP